MEFLNIVFILPDQVLLFDSPVSAIFFLQATATLDPDVDPGNAKPGISKFLF
jgi:hypothetical protein